MVEKLYIETKAEAAEGLDERLPLELTRPGCNGYQSRKFSFRCCVYMCVCLGVCVGVFECVGWLV